MEDTYLKDNIKKCVDYVMSKNDDDKRRILNGMFQYNDYLINEQLVVKALNDEEKQEWFNNEIFEAKDREIERLNNIIENLTTMTANGDRTQIKNTAQYKLEQAQERIDKAIEWIFYQQEHSMEPYIATDTLDDLLEILKGE
jgi:hypothetical protein